MNGNAKNYTPSPVDSVLGNEFKALKLGGPYIKPTHHAIVNHFDTTYGQASSLAAWQAFSRDVGVQEGGSITQCKKVTIHPLI